ncbi:putative glucan endo-1,3-beta-glucosidase 12-like [Capsicum annuum]|nr:putative glucan endo-1,3-beta-glucosidase 12-like [Capsicum annuum]
MNLDPRSDESVCFLRTLIDSAETSQQKMVAYHRLGCVKFLRKELEESEQLFEAAFNLDHTYSVVGLARLGQIRGYKHWAHEKLSSVSSSSIPLGWMYQESSLYCQGEKRWDDLENSDYRVFEGRAAALQLRTLLREHVENWTEADCWLPLYDRCGLRLMILDLFQCIPYRCKTRDPSSCVQGSPIDDLEFLLISSQKNPRMMFPKVGWEIDESLEEAASRETFEEAGVVGEVEVQVNFSEAREVCWHPWMKEALDVFASKVSKRKEGTQIYTISRNCRMNQYYCYQAFFNKQEPRSRCRTLSPKDDMTIECHNIVESSRLIVVVVDSVESLTVVDMGGKELITDCYNGVVKILRMIPLGHGFFSNLSELTLVEIPCAHTIVVLKSKNVKKMKLYCSDYYKKETLVKTYEMSLCPMPDKRD